MFSTLYLKVIRAPGHFVIGHFVTGALVHWGIGAGSGLRREGSVRRRGRGPCSIEILIGSSYYLLCQKVISLYLVSPIKIVICNIYVAHLIALFSLISKM